MQYFFINIFHMNILITGGSGFIGSHLIKKLLKIYTNIQIFSIDNYLSGSPNNDYIEDKRIIYLKNSSIIKFYIIISYVF